MRLCLCVCVCGGGSGGGGGGGNSVEIAIIRITLLSFLLHFLFDLLRSPEGSWVGAEDSPARVRPADVLPRQPECDVPINLEPNVAENQSGDAAP